MTRAALAVDESDVRPRDEDGRPRTIWSDDTEPWGIEGVPGENGNYWGDKWHVRRERGLGSFVAEFEFAEHAVAFVQLCGPCNGEVVAVDA